MCNPRASAGVDSLERWWRLEWGPKEFLSFFSVLLWPSRPESYSRGCGPGHRWGKLSEVPAWRGRLVGQWPWLGTLPGVYCACQTLAALVNHDGAEAEAESIHRCAIHRTRYPRLEAPHSPPLIPNNAQYSLSCILGHTSHVIRTLPSITLTA